MYTEFFEFRGRPFQLTPDTRFFFESRTHKKAISYLTYGLHQREGFVVVTGEVGAGKTTLIDYLLSKLDPSKFRVAKIVTTQVEADDLLRMIAAAFEISASGADKSSLIAELRDFFERSNAANVRPEADTSKAAPIKRRSPISPMGCTNAKASSWSPARLARARPP